MSISSDASKPSSANSKPAFLSWFDRPTAIAIRDALPRSFYGLVPALLLFVWFVPVLPGASFAQQLGARWTGALLPSLAIMGATLLVVLAIRLARALDLAPVPYIATCVAAFALSLPQTYASGVLPYLKLAGSTALFLAIVVALLAAFVFKRLGAPIATIALLVLFASLWFVHAPLADLLHTALAPLGALGDSYAALMLVVVIETLLWLVGIHGPAALAAIVTPVYMTLQSQNGDAYAHHATLPHVVVVSLFLFVFPGGAGATLPLAAMLALSRVDRLRTVGRAVIVPSFFNINEPLLFGLPVAYNGFLAVPFVLAPAVLATITYLAVVSGWVMRPIAYVPSAIPTVISTYLATFDVRAIVLAVVNIAVAAAIYYPFVRAYERHEMTLET